MPLRGYQIVDNGHVLNFHAGYPLTLYFRGNAEAVRELIIEDAVEIKSITAEEAERTIQIQLEPDPGAGS